MISTLRALRAPIAALTLVLSAPGAASAFEGNRVQVFQDGDRNTATVVQNGASNTAAMRQTSGGQSGVIVQNGDGNTACLVQMGPSRSSAIVQNGGESVAVLQGAHRTREISLNSCMRFVNLRHPFGQIRGR